MEKKNVYIIGSKGIPAKYGGFETFVEKLTEKQREQTIQYHIACMSDNSAKSGITNKHFIHNNADCFNVKVPNIGPAKAVYYDIAALNYAIKLAKQNKDVEPIFYILACRIGPFIAPIKKKIEKINGKLFVNPDGHEWLRAKWGYLVRKYWKSSERLMVKSADLLICDSKNIEKYIRDDYSIYKPNTVFIAYGAETTKSTLKNEDKSLLNWYEEYKVSKKQYYMIVGRFVPENNYETLIREFMKSNSKKDFVLITNIKQNGYYEKLRKATKFEKDKRIKFVGTVYDQNLLKKIRENAYGYFHGHEVGGTNPSLLEALGSTELNLLLDVGFNKEVAKENAYYWTKNDGELASLIQKLDKVSEKEIIEMGEKAKLRIKRNYSWHKIVEEYELLFIEN